jgi:hypothetical protein
MYDMHFHTFSGLVEITVNCYFSSTVNVIFCGFLLIFLMPHIACSTMHIVVNLRDSF